MDSCQRRALLAAMDRDLTVGIVTREYPPEVYGGAGVHVEGLVRFLKQHLKVEVHCFGQPRSLPEVAGTYQPWSELSGAAPHMAALRTVSVDLAVTAKLAHVNLVHTHTWYSNLAGHFAKLLYGIPHVMTSHSLEPLRPWKAEQLGGGYALSCFCERLAIESADTIIAVSSGMKNDILRAYPSVSAERVQVIYNGIDPDEIGPNHGTEHLLHHGIDPNRPYAVFVGRVTRQKGIVNLLQAARHLTPGTQLVFCAGEADTPELAQEVRGLYEDLSRSRGHMVWIDGMVTRPALSQILTHARAFVCPSIYEPFGIVNVEAMACGTAVVASRVGGIPEIVVEKQTGALVPFESDGTALGGPADPEGFARDFARATNELLDDGERSRQYGAAGRERVLREFSWAAIAEKTAALYRRLC